MRTQVNRYPPEKIQFNAIMKNNRLLVVTPLQEEFDFFLLNCINRGYQAEAFTIGRLLAQYFSDLNIVLACGGHGKTQFGIQVQYLLDHLDKVDMVLCVGAAGGLVDYLSVGDVVVASSTVEHDYLLKFNKRPLPRFNGAKEVIDRLQRFPLYTQDYKVYFGPVASGDEDVIDIQRSIELRSKTGAIAVAWEGAGGARACAFNQVPFLEIRCITDTANHNAPADFEANLAIAIHNLVDFITLWVTRGHTCQEKSHEQ